MKNNFFLQSAAPAALLLAALVAAPAQASYICTGASGSASGNPYFNGDLTDPLCDTTEVEDFLGITIDTNLIVGSKSDSVGESPITSWIQDEFGMGTLTVTHTSNTSGTWELTGGGITPLIYVDKYDGGYDVYSYMGTGTDPFSDSWDETSRGSAGYTNCGRGMMGSINCEATTSHISVYGVVPVPAAVWLFGSGLLGLVGIARRKRS